MKYFIYSFGQAGTLTPVPDAAQANGTVSYNQGFPVGYELIDTDPASLNIPRDQFNQLMNDVTSSIQQLQQYGVPYFITSSMNGGTAYPYAKNAIVYQPVDGNVYQSLVANNTTTPPSSSWQLFSASESSLYLNYAVDTGSANAYVTAPSPSISAYQEGIVVLLKPKFGNTGACTINVNGLGTVPIKTLTNLDPSSGMIIPSGLYLLAYNATTSSFVVLNPTLGTAAYANTGTANGQVPLLNNTAASSGKVVFGNITYQWGIGTASSSGTGATNTFGTAFSGTPYHISCTTIASSIVSFTTGDRPSLATNTWTATGFNVLSGDYTTSVSWLAIGPT